ncbi:hypothetical protein ACIBCT_20700 [Streptosporangium sp. NPDC050855]|uniref:hypothetical protein n=1 Tax=Streptosporangium sp. NPDC050855 TaxID=3366194 RepID=UPI00379AD293
MLVAVADRIAALPHTRVGQVDLCVALREVAPASDVAQAAWDLLVTYLRAEGVDTGWLLRWTPRCGRDEAAAYLRAAAEVIA